jgi:outer membrane protein assembly factor BamB
MAWAMFLIFTWILQGAAAQAAVSFRAFRKSTYPVEDAVFTGMMPNVLFFLDSSTSMAMSMKGQLPVFNSWNDKVMQRDWSIMRDANFRASLLKEMTYGMGGRPVSKGYPPDQKARLENNGLTLPFVSPYQGTELSNWELISLPNTRRSDWLGYSRAGRDVDVSNNRIGDPDSYYSPDPNRPYLLTFLETRMANWDGGSDASMFPGEMKPYLPGGSMAGKPMPDDVARNSLMPNDSKMYKMKLVLWRLLSPENADILSKMKIGVVSDFAEHFWDVNARAAVIRRPPYRRDEDYVEPYYTGKKSDMFYAIHNGKRTPIHFPYGSAPSGYSGISDPPTPIAVAAGISGGGLGDYSMGEVGYSGILNVYKEEVSQRYADNYLDGDRERMKRHVFRALLRVPFDVMYTLQGDGTFRPTPSVIAFRELIDGIEQINFANGVPLTGRIVNDEIAPSGAPDLSRMIYGRDGFHVRGGMNLQVLGTPGDAQYAVTYARGVRGVKTQHLGYYDWLRGLKYQMKQQTSVIMNRLRNSEGLMTGTALGSVIDFFSPLAGILPFTEGPEASDTRGYFPVTGSCQSNWLVVFTGGNDREAAITIQNSLKNLYLNSRTLRGRHWTGSKWIERNYEMDNPIRTIFVGMVPMDDANRDGDPYAPDRTDDSSSKRMRKAIRRMAHAGQPLRDGRPDTTVEPYFADNAPDLLNALQSIMQKIRTEQFSAGAPVLLPIYEDSDNGERALFSSFYSLNTQKQWKSSFARYDIPKDGAQKAAMRWEADALMSADVGNRRVYTTKGPAGTSDSALVSLKALNDKDFAALAQVPAEHAAKFRDWLLRYPGEPGILGDMEHSGVAIVGSADLEGIAPREKRIYLQTNRGVLHSLNYDKGGEEWAFIPPNIFQHRIRDQKFLDGRTWIDGDGDRTLASRPLVLLDGMLSFGDVTIDGTPRTCMLGALGWGGNSFYAMDVTRPGSEPVFRWAIDNVRYAEVEKNPADGVKRWGAAAGSGNYDYSDLGLTIVSPALLHTETADVGIIPGGLGYHFGADSQGKALYIFSPKDGSIVRKIDMPGMGITPVTYFSSNSSGSSTSKTTEFITGDSEGWVLRCDTTRDLNDWALAPVFRLLSSAKKPVALTKAISAGRTAKGGRWLFGGTSDLMVPDFSEQRVLKNDEQYIFALNLGQVEKRTSPPTTSDLISLKYLLDPGYIPSYGVSEDQTPVPTDALGWSLKLRPKMDHDRRPTDAEYVTSAPFLSGGVLYVSTFIPRTRKPGTQEHCEALGDGRFYALDPMTGVSKWKNGQQALLFADVKIVGISASQGSLFLGVRELQKGALELLRGYEELKDLNVLAEGTVLQIPAIATDSAPDVSLERVVPHLQYWREFF